jgi:hypothetical protein
VAFIITDVCNYVIALCCWQQQWEVMSMKMFAKLDEVKSNTGKGTGRQTNGRSIDCADSIVREV